MKKKLVSLLLVVSLLTSLFTACGNPQSDSTTAGDSKTTETGEKETSQQDKTEPESSTAEKVIENFNPEGYPIVNEKITLKVMIHISDAYKPSDLEEMPQIKKLQELTGIDMEFEVVRAADWSTKLTLAFAGGEYPDMIIAANNVDYEDYGVRQGILIPLTELIEEYIPNVTERAAMVEEPYRGITASDGELYAIPRQWSSTTAKTDYFWFVNQVWLDALKLEMPTDLDSLVEVLRAFKTGDPNGNGEADEIPMTLQSGLIFLVNNLFGVPQDGNHFYIDDNKKIQLVHEQEGFKKAMEWMHMLYKEGLLDPESLTQDSKTFKAKLNEGIVGVSNLYRLGNQGYGESAKNMELWVPEVKDAKFYSTNPLPTAGVFITSTNKYPEATARLINAFLDFETMMSLYHGEKDGEVYGWKYDEAGRAESFGKAESPRTNLSTNGIYYMPRPYAEKYFNGGVNAEEREEYSDIYEQKGLLNKYAATYLFEAKLDQDLEEEKAILKADYDTTMTEWITKFIVEGVNDGNYAKMLSTFKSIKSDRFKELLQQGIDAQNLN